MVSTDVSPRSTAAEIQSRDAWQAAVVPAVLLKEWPHRPVPNCATKWHEILAGVGADATAAAYLGQSRVTPIDRLMRAADANLYRAKNGGRNRIAETAAA